MNNVVIAQDLHTLSLCLDVRRRVFVDECGVAAEIERDGNDVTNGACEHFLITRDGAPAGALRCCFDNGVVRLQRFCVLAEHRGSGLGRTAVEFVERYYRQKGAERAELDAKCSSQGFYESCGYSVVSEQFVEAGVLHVKMLKEI